MREETARPPSRDEEVEALVPGGQCGGGGGSTHLAYVSPAAQGLVCFSILNVLGQRCSAWGRRDVKQN